MTLINGRKNWINKLNINKVDGKVQVNYKDKNKETIHSESKENLKKVYV